MNVTLVGYRGSGKSTVAPLLAARWGWAWADADAEIERRAGRTIREIFDTSGEPEFRRLERETIAELLAGDRCVIATGGGCVMDEGTRAAMRRAGPVVWLQAAADVLFARIAGDATTAARRPALTTLPGRSEIEHLLAVREPWYRDCARLVVPADRLTAAEIVDRIDAELASVLAGKGRS